MSLISSDLHRSTRQDQNVAIGFNGDPVPPFTGIGAAGIIAVQCIASVAILAFFRRTKVDRRAWNTLYRKHRERKLFRDRDRPLP